MGTRMRIGELLVAAKAITESQLEEALHHPRKEGERLGDVLVALGMVSETQLTQALSQQLAIPWVSLYHVDFSRPLLNLVPKELAERYCLVPVLVRKSKKRGEQLFVAMDDPTNDAALEQMAQYCGLTVKPMLASRSDIRAAIRVYYYGGEGVEAQAQAPAQERPPAPSSPKAASMPPPAPPPATAQSVSAPATIPPEDFEADEVAEEEAAEPEEALPSGDSPEATPEIEAREIIPKPKGGPAVPMVALTLLDGTTIQLPARRGRTPSSPDLTPAHTDLTARDLVAALRAVGHGADASQILGESTRWETIVASLISVLLRKGLIADWEFIEEYRKKS